MKRIFVIFFGRFPGERAAALFAAKGAEAFSNKGLEVVLIVPKRLGRERGSSSEYYGIKDTFKTVYLPLLDTFSIPIFKRVSFFIGILTFSISTFIYLFFNAKKTDIVYSNEIFPIFLSSLFFPKTMYEMHDFPESKFSIFGVFVNRIKWILIHNKWKTELFIKKFKFPREKIITEPNAVDINSFRVDISKEEARKKLSLPIDKKIILYTGHLYSWKGVYTLADVAKKLSNDYLIVFVGGTKEDEKKFNELYGGVENIKIVGWRPHSEIPLWQKTADVLVLPNTAKEHISKFYTSPMKLFEYAASGRPIIASNIPSVTELISTESVFLFNPDSPDSLSHEIEALFNSGVTIGNKVENAMSWVKEHTWDKRADRIISFINSTK